MSATCSSRLPRPRTTQSAISTSSRSSTVCMTGDPTGAAAHVKQSLKSDGSWMIVEPMAGDKLEDNLNPLGRIYYAASTMVCVPTSLSQEVGEALGAQAGEAKLREVITAGGFRTVESDRAHPSIWFWKRARRVLGVPGR